MTLNLSCVTCILYPLRMSHHLIAQLLRGINTVQVLQPVCAKGSSKADKVDWDQRILMSTPNYFLHSLPRNSAFWCRVSLFLSLSLSFASNLILESMYITDWFTF